MPELVTPVVVVAPGDDLLGVVADETLTRLHDAQRSLTDVTLVAAYSGVVRGLRATLSEVAAARGLGALLGPQIMPYHAWRAQLSRQLPRPRVLHELRLYDLLRGFPQHFDHSDLWQVCDSMLPLLEELDTQQIDPSALGGLAQRDVRLVGQLGQEAQVISAVWRALRDDEPGDSPLTLAYQARQAFANLSSGAGSATTVFVGCDDFNALECALLKDVLQRGRALVFLQHEDRHPNHALAELLEQLPISHRASSAALRSGYAFLRHSLDEAPLDADTRAANANGYQHRWAIVPCIDDETQVQFVADDIATTLAAERPAITVVSENRRLLRRLRAVLESRSIAVDDEAGWTLSTTAAATVVQRLLDSIDQDFHYLPFLDFLKSPYLSPPGLFDSREQLDATVHQFERRVIRRAQVHSELYRFCGHIEAQAAQAEPVHRRELEQQLALLRAIETATQDLARFHAQARPRRASEFLAALCQALEQLGCGASLREDPAGAQLLTLLVQLERDAGARIRLDWGDARTWLARSLEQQHYQPQRRGADVRLLNLREAVLERFDIVYLVGANQELFPGHDTNVSAFFNDGVRRELGIRTHSDTLALTRLRFKLLLSNATTVIACFARESQGEPLQVTQWLTALDSAHKHVYSTGLLSAEVTVDAMQHATATPELPPSWAAISARPATGVDTRLIPDTLSASAHQRLIDCPYLFYVQDCLQLRPEDEIAEKLRKSEYGNRVHSCLQAFHSEPETAELLQNDPQAAEQRLFELSARIFRRDIQSNFEHRVWLHRWQRSIPPYIAWQAQRAQRYPLIETEVALSRPLHGDLRIEGKIDRIDRDSGGASAIIDYKTGQAGSTAAVRGGEDVQIVSYALLVDTVERIEYLQFDGDRIRRSGVLEDGEITTVSDAIAARLIDVTRRVHDGAPMPAWQGPRCGYCDMQGVCRQPLWHLSAR